MSLSLSGRKRCIKDRFAEKVNRERERERGKLANLAVVVLYRRLNLLTNRSEEVVEVPNDKDDHYQFMCEMD